LQREKNNMKVRRVVTGNNENGESYFIFNGFTPGYLDFGYCITNEIWVDDPANPDPKVLKDPVDVEKYHIAPPLNGSLMRVLTIRPDGIKLTSEQLAANERFNTGDTMEKDNPGMHTTHTIDYGIIISGEIDLELDKGIVHLIAGDVVVQRGTRHAWRNNSSKPCTIAFVGISSPNYQ
jgi:mannose-6-phosphate isomerase-like protein (cupin superfamily)